MDLNVLINGLTTGSLYALVAVGFNILYRPTNVFNFAQGDLVMLGAMVTATALVSWALPWPLALLLSMVIVGAIALFEERVAVSPIIRRSAHGAAWIISTLAISLIIANLADRLWGPDPIGIKPPWPLSTQTLGSGEVRISSYQIALWCITILAVVVIEGFYRTRRGKAVLAIAEDRDAALLRGIDPDRLNRWSFALGGAFAALAGVLAAPILYASTGLGPLLLLKGFEAAAVGGVGNNRGALLAGYVLGIAEAVGALLLSPGYQQATTYGVLLVILLIRPQGLFGVPEARRV